ncbi:NepR family anti-sigma factor [Shimia ponticola]|uniref:NepR family anti-sigma factor n=1 Tax=Shimia ponticola TaxID=2582893 RepID=UPI0011BEE679|nr:NepR family anti-sigma factor [Shimia ponticola]
MTRPEKTSRIAEEIDKNLRRAYDEVAQEELPDRFANLLQQLREKDSANPANGTGGEADE